MEQQHDEAWWQAHLDAIEREDIPTKHYAQREGLPVAQLYAWRKRIKERARRRVVTCTDVSRFVAVRLEPAPVPVSISAPAPVLGRFAELPGQVLTTEKYLTDWLRSQQKRLKASTYEGYRKIVDYQLIPRLGQIKLADIKRRDLRDWMDEMDASNKRLANIQSVLRKALTDAVEDELLDDNPLMRYTYRKTQPPQKRDTVDPFTPTEQSAILGKCLPAMANQVQFALWTGVRTSELVALTWDDIDFRRGVIIIDKALTQAAKGTIEDTKTLSGRREVKMLGPARAALLAQKAHTYLAGGPVFTHPIKGTPWSGDQEIRKYWVKLLRLAQVRYRRPYQTRHTYASMMLSAGEHPMWVARQMGHNNWAMIIRVYGKWMPSADDQAGSRAVGQSGRGKICFSQIKSVSFIVSF